MQHKIRFHIEEFGPGKCIQNPKPGDFVLTRGHEWTSFLIRVGERLRYRGKDRKFAYWNHAALLIDENGGIIEALGCGVKAGNIQVHAE